MARFQPLRQHILFLALRGLLVPQLDHEPVQKQFGPAPAFGKMPFVVPPKWVWAQFKALGGQVIRGSDTVDITSECCISSSDLHANQGVFIYKQQVHNADKHNTDKIENFDEHLIPAGSVLYIIQGDCIGDLAITTQKCSINSYCSALTVNCCIVDVKWLYYVLMYATPFIRKQMFGTAIGKVATDVFRELWIPLPPLAEQHRICAKLDDLMQHVMLCEQSYSKFAGPQSDRLRNIILELAFTGKLLPQLDDDVSFVFTDVASVGTIDYVGRIPFKVPVTWTWCYVGDIMDVNPSGCIDCRSDNGSNKLKVKMFESSNVSDVSGIVDWKGVPCRYVKAQHAYRTLLKINDIVVVRTGTACGKHRVITEVSDLPCVFNKAMMRLRVKADKSALVDLSYISLYFNSPFYWRKITSFMHGSTRSGITGGQIDHLLVPLPPRAEQRRIVAKVSELFERIEQQTAALKFAVSRVVN